MFFGRTIRLPRTLSFRLTLWYGLIFSISSCLAFLFFYLLITINLKQRLDDRLSEKISEFEAIYNLQGIDEVKEAVFGSPPNLHDLDAAMLVKWYNDLSCVYDSLGFCMFSDSFEVMGPTLYARLYSAVTGHSITPVELMTTGERIFNIMRVYNIREGMRREHDDWPQRFYDQPLRLGEEIHTLSNESLEQSLRRYYELRGWDAKTGVPTEGTLRELQLHDVADDLLIYVKKYTNLKD